MREVKEAYRYLIGRYARAVRVNPTLQAYQNLTDVYQHEFPRDTGEDDARFRRKADPYIKKNGESASCTSRKKVLMVGSGNAGQVKLLESKRHLLL